MKGTPPHRGIRRIKHVPRLPARPKDAHKGHFGRVLVLGGSVGMAGAPAMAALAALRTGSGLVTIAVPASIQSVVATLCPCATTIGLPEIRGGFIDPTSAKRLLQQRGLLTRCEDSAPPDVLIVGPGLGRGGAGYGTHIWKLIDAFRLLIRCKTVIDADALNLAGPDNRICSPPWDEREHYCTVITPHPGELARMRRTSTKTIQQDRENAAIDTARRLANKPAPSGCKPTVVLKGAGTVVTDGQRIYVNKTGNPGMATGGSGDVLTGIIGSALGQGLDCFDAAVFGTFLHGLAGDQAAKDKGEASLIATDIIEALPKAMKILEGHKINEKKVGGRSTTVF